jgi:tetratricopeptide (TPR) repeat protein
MNNAKKYSEDPIKIRSIMGSGDSFVPKKESDYLEKQQRQFQSHMLTMSRQIENLMETTANLIHRPKEKNGFLWNYLLITVGIALFLCGLTFYGINNQQKELSRNLTQEMHSKITDVKTLFSEHAQITQNTIKRLENTQKEQHLFTINAFHKIEKGLLSNKENTLKLNSKLELQRRNITNLSKNLVQLQIRLENPINETKKNQLRSKLNAWEKSQTTVSSPASRLLNRYEQKAKTFSTSNLSVSEKNKTFANAYVKVAWTETQKGNIPKALTTYKKAIKLNPGLAMAYYNLACLYAREGHKDKAIFWLKEGRPYFPSSLVTTAAHDKDLKSLHNDPYFNFMMFGSAT